MSRRKTKALLDRVDRLHDNSLPPVILLCNNPEAVRLGFDAGEPLRSRSEAQGPAGRQTDAQLENSTGQKRIPRGANPLPSWPRCLLPGRLEAILNRDSRAVSGSRTGRNAPSVGVR
jgi:hypothetical protein